MDEAHWLQVVVVFVANFQYQKPDGCNDQQEPQPEPEVVNEGEIFIVLQSVDVCAIVHHRYFPQTATRVEQRADHSYPL